MAQSIIFKINDLVDLRLIDDRTYIYINNERFLICACQLLNIPRVSFIRNRKRIQEAYEIKSIDEAAEVFRDTQWLKWQNSIVGRPTRFQYKTIAPEEEFKGYCSNIQAFFENGLSTDILASNIAFPLLKKLIDLGYEPAIRVFKEEIVRRYKEGASTTQLFLDIEGYLNYLKNEEKQLLKELNVPPISLWKFELELSELTKKERRKIRCPMCDAIGKKNFKKVEGKSKILYYVSLVPIYAKKYICKQCGYEF